MPIDQHRLVGYAIGGVVFLLILGLRMQRMLQRRPFNPQFVWILPAVFLVMAALAFSAAPPAAVEWAWVAASFGIGAGLGWFRAKTIALTRDPETGQVMAQGTPLAMLLLLALFAVRFGLRAYLQTQSTTIGVRLPVIDDAFLAMAVGLFLARAIEMGVRARTLLQAPAAAV
jgi:hypothetical protein